MTRDELLRVGDRLRSNGGRGPLVAEVVAVDGRLVHLERWDPSHKRPRRRAFALPAWYLRARSCGWVEARDA